MAFTATTVNSAKAWAPDHYTFAPEDVVPEALIMQLSTVAGSVQGDEVATRVAYIDDDQATITAEGAQIDEADPALAERLVYTAKITQLLRVSTEQYSQPGTAGQLAQSVGRALTRRANLAFAAEEAPTPPAVAPMAGLVNVEGLVNGGGVADSLDALIDLIAELQDNLATPTHILLDPLGWAEFRKLKTGTDRNMSLLGAGTTDAQAMLLSLPVVVDPAMWDYTGLVIDRNAIVSAVGPINIDTSLDRYFDTDCVGIRATWRTGHVVVRPNRIGVFGLGSGGS